MTAVARAVWATFAGPVSLGLHPTTVRRLQWALPVLLIISIFYVFMASVGDFHDQAWQLDYYDQMAEGFRRGHLYIARVPLPVLLAKPDPFAYSNVRLWLWDASLFNGHYYMYWGPVPGLMLLGFKLLTGTHERITDQWPTTLLMLGRLYAGAGLILSLAGRVRTRQPPWICALAIGVFALANPSPFIVARPHVYEACLAGGQCFLFWGLFWAFWGLEKPERRRLFFLFAGLSWALAVGCRATNFISAPLAMAITGGFAWYHSRRSLKGFVLDGVALSAPFAAAAVAYGAYNYARFDSVTEFGVNYQVTMQPFNGNSAYVLPNVYSYLFAPVKWTCDFPFVHIIGYRALSPLLTWPPGYQSFERVGGILFTAAWSWLVLLCPLQVGDYLWTRFRRTTPAASASNLSPHEAWALLCSIAIMLSMAPVLKLWEASMRYVGDALGGIVLASTVSVFWLFRRSYVTRFRPLGLLARGLVLALGVQTCVLGALSAFTSSDDPFRTKNPVLYQKLHQSLSFCSKSN